MNKKCHDRIHCIEIVNEKALSLTNKHDFSLELFSNV